MVCRRPRRRQGCPLRRTSAAAAPPLTPAPGASGDWRIWAPGSLWSLLRRAGRREGIVGQVGSGSGGGAGGGGGTGGPGIWRRGLRLASDRGGLAGLEQGIDGGFVVHGEAVPLSH